MRLFDNLFGGAEVKGIAMVWDLKNMSEMDLDDGRYKEPAKKLTVRILEIRYSINGRKSPFQ
jgi:hypothetical protein